MYLSVLPARMFVDQMHAWWLQRPEMGIKLLQLELQKVMNSCAGVGNLTWVLCKISRCS